MYLTTPCWRLRRKSICTEKPENSITEKGMGTMRSKSKEIKRLQKELEEAKCQIKLLREVRAKFLSVPKVCDLIERAKAMDFENMDDRKLGEACVFPIWENLDSGKWIVSTKICLACGNEFGNYEFRTKKDALEFGYILTQLGWQLDSSGACPQCCDEYIQAEM